jgi:shikimate dehydrogenase
VAGLVPGKPVTARPTGRAAVLGSPISHSRSPVLHRAAYAALGLDGWRYDAYQVDEEGFEPWFQEARARTHAHGDVPGWAGLSLTMPLKRVVIPLLDTIDPLAEAVGAVNTVVFDADGTAKGFNTDVYGIVAALGDAGVTRVESAAVIGSGATAASTLSALQLIGCSSAHVYARSVGRAGEVEAAGAALGAPPTVHPLGELRAGLDVDVVVSTLPSGAGDGLSDVLAGQLASSRDRGRPVPALLDVVYAPWPTALATVWEGLAPGRVVGGSAMLLYQAASQVELMTGLKAPVAAMREALHAP